MIIDILGTESLGVRGMSCLVTVGKRRILIDPGLALGYQRHGLLPHPRQVTVGVKIRQTILQAMASATDVVFSHFHGDHVPLLRANPYQLSFQQLPSSFTDLRCWSLYSSGEKFLQDLSPLMHRRALDLAELSGANMKKANCSDGPLCFSKRVPHGLPGSRFGSVMMTRIEMEGQVFVHASDIQLLDEMTIEKILLWNPDIVFTAGPPLYLQALTGPLRRKAWENALWLAKNVEILIVDHHLLRSTMGLVWLDGISQAVGKKIYCAADFMNKPRLLLEARRTELYKEFPVAENWHENYEKGRISPSFLRK